MSGDYSRWSFDPRRDFAAVLMQQGRVQTDADWNEGVATILRRIRAGTLDTAGRAVVSSETPDAFVIAASGGSFTIEPGRMYVDGILAENHGDAPFGWDPRVEQLAGAGAIEYAAQPFYPNAPALPVGGPHTVYLKVWQREITAIEDPRLIEKALGVDTTTRMQTVWQVKVLAGDGTMTVECDTPLETVPGFTDEEPAAGGRLTTGTADVAGDPDPCLVPVTGGYKGLENQLYRVEIHDPGDLAGTDRATFKWSRDNGVVASRAIEIPTLDEIVVESIGRDSLLRFSDGDWVEITDDWRELNGLPGEMRRIATPNGVNDVTGTILLEDSLPAGAFPVDAQDRTDPARNTRIRRWDQRGTVRKADGTTHADLDQAASGGVIPVATGTSEIVLENGITVTFDLDAAGGRFRTGDHWLFAARTADASVELLDEAPPVGIHAHYATLASVTFPDDETDLRACPPPPEPVEGGGCECDACVSVEEHTSGSRTIQDAIDEVIAAGGGTICLGIGTYEVPETLRIHGARSLRLRGKGWGTVLVAAKGGGVIDVQTSANVTLEGFAIITASPNGAGTAVTLGRCIATTVQDCAIVAVQGEGMASVGIGLEGYQLGTTITRCALVASAGVSAGAQDDDYALTASLRVTDNWLFCLERGVELERFAVHLGDTRITDNLALGCRDAGLVAVGGNSLEGAFTVADNACIVQGTGIIVGVDASSITGNDVRFMGEGTASGDGIALAPSLLPGGIDHCKILGNRIHGVPRHGIAIRTRVESGIIKDNLISETGGAGIVTEAGGEAGVLAVENNQLLDIGGAVLEGAAHVGILLSFVQRADVAANVIDGLAREAIDSELRAGIAVVLTATTRIASNRLSGIAPPTEFGGLTVGILVPPLFGKVDVVDNRVQRRRTPDDKVGQSAWMGVVVGSLEEVFEDRRLVSFGVVNAALGEERAYVFSAAKIRAVDVRAIGDVGILGNTIESEASEPPPVFVSRVRGMRLSDNHIGRVGDNGGRPSEVHCVRAVVSSNELRDVIEAVVLDVDTGGNEAAILGNVHSGRILLNGSDLQPPWSSLNPLVV